MLLPLLPLLLLLLLHVPYHVLLGGREAPPLELHHMYMQQKQQQQRQQRQQHQNLVWQFIQLNIPRLGMFLSTRGGLGGAVSPPQSSSELKKYIFSTFDALR